MATGGTHSQGALSKIIVEPGSPTYTFDASSYQLEYLSSTLAKHGRHGGDRGIRGTLVHEESRVRELTPSFHGAITMYVSPNDLDWILDSMLGYTESGPSDTWTADDTLPYFGLLVDTDYETWLFSDCMVDHWILRGRAAPFNSQGEPDLLVLQMYIVASTITKSTSWPGSPPSLGTTAVEDAPYAFSDCAITLVGSARAAEEFVLASYHNLKVKTANQLTAHSIRPRDRITMASFRVPWNSTNADLYGIALAGAAGNITATNGACNTIITFGNFKVPDNSPIIPGKDQISLEVNGQIRGDGSTLDLVITNDHTV